MSQLIYNDIDCEGDFVRSKLPFSFSYIANEKKAPLFSRVYGGVGRRLSSSYHDRTWFDAYSVRFTLQNFTSKNIRSMYRGFNCPGAVYVSVKNLTFVLSRQMGYQINLDGLEKVVEDITSAYKRFDIRQALTLAGCQTSNSFKVLWDHVPRSVEECESAEEVLSIKKEKISAKNKQIDDESWFIPTGVVILDGNKKIPTIRCHRIMETYQRIIVKSPILRDFAYEILVKHAEKCFMTTCKIRQSLSDIFFRLRDGKDVLTSNSGGYSKPKKILEPQMFSWFGKVDKAADDITQSSEKVGGMCDSITAYINVVKNKTKKSEFEFKTLAFNIIRNLSFFITNPSMITGAMAIGFSLIDLAVINFNHYSSILGPLANLFGSAEKKQPKSVTIEAQLDDDRIKSWASAISSLIAVILATMEIKNYDSLDTSSMLKGLFVTSRNVWFFNMFFKQVFEDTIKIVARIWEWGLKKIYGPRSLRHLFAEEPKHIEEWAADVCRLVDSNRLDEILDSPELSHRVIERNIQGCCLTVYMADDATKLKVAPVIRSLAEKISKLYDKVVEYKKFSPARYEPFVVWVTGEPNIGKSFIIEELIRFLLEKKGITTDAPIFNRSPGSPYYNTLTANHLAAFFDDFGCVDTDGLADHIAEFFALKTSSAFNPPMADLPDKKRYFNPYLVFMTSNKSHPVFNKVADDEAFCRRRDMVVNMALSDSAKSIKDYTDAELAARSHLRYKIWDINKPTSNTPISYTFNGGKWGAAMDHASFLKTLGDAWIEYDKREKVNYARRIKSSNRILLSKKLGADGFSNSPNKFYEELIKFDAKNTTTRTPAMTQIIDMVKSMQPTVPQMDAYRGLQTKKVEYRDKDLVKIPFAIDESGDYPFYEGSIHASIDKPHYVNESEDVHKFLGPDDCLHKYYKGLTLIEKGRYSFGSKMFTEPLDGLFYRRGQPYSGLDFYVMLPFLKFLNESAYFIPNRKCSYSDCIYDTEEFSKLVEENYQINVRCGRTVEVPPCVMGEKVKAKVRDGEVDFIKKVISTSAEDNQNNFWIVEDGDSCVAFEKVEDERISKYVTILSVLKTIGKWLVFLLGIILCVSGIKKLVDYCSTSKKEDIYEDYTEMTPLVPNLHPSGDTQTMKLAKTHRFQKNISGQMDEQYLQSIYNGVERNTFFIVGRDGPNDVHPIVARCLGVHDNKAIGLVHYFERFDKNKEYDFELAFKVKDHYTHVPVNLSHIIIEKIPDSGLVILSLPFQIPPFKDIRDRFYPNNEILDISKASELIEIQMGYKPRIYHKKFSIKHVEGTWVEGSQYSKGWSITKGFSYPYGGKGVCGSVLVSLSSRPSIIGIHTAGANTFNYGISELVCRSMFSKKIKIVDRMIPQMDNADNARFQLEGIIVPIGKVQTPVNLSEKSKIIPSVIHGTYPIKTAPAPLSSKDPRITYLGSPLFHGCMKQTLNTVSMPPMAIDRAVNSLFNKLDKVVKPVRILTDLTYLEAARGLDIDGYKSIEMTTSEGYPWVINRPRNASNKKYLFEFDAEDRVIGINNTLKAVMDRKQALRNERIIPVTIFMDCLKDTRISLAKIDKPGATRVFNIQPVDYTIQSRQYYMDFNVALSKNRLSAENTIGINVNGPEWSNLYRALNNFSKYILVGDFRSFGDTLEHRLLRRIAERQAKWYRIYQPKSKFHISREVTPYEINQCMHLAKDLVYITLCGQPSGGGSTIEYNTLSGSSLARMAFEELTGICVTCFDKYVVIFTNGDDWIMSVHSSIIHRFNNQTLQAYFKQFNIIYTSVDKSEVMAPYVSIEEAVYLKCKFVRHPIYNQEWLAPLCVDSVLECSQWIHKIEDEEEASMVNTLASIRLSYGHGKEFYNNLADELTGIWAIFDDYVDVPSWDQEDDRIWESLFDQPDFESINAMLNFIPNMEDAHGEGNVKVGKAGTTVIESQREASIASLPSEKNSSNELCAGGCETSSVVKSNSFDPLSDRWLMVGNFAWGTKDMIGTSLAEYSLPYDVVKNNSTIPNIMPFKIHRYWRGDMEVRLMINSNKFQIGQLQMSWYYCAEEDLYYTQHRKSVFNASQRIHGLASAGSSNEIIINIPYHHYLSYLYTSVVGTYVSSALELGKLIIMPINALTVMSQTYKTANCQVMIRFKNSCFVATVDQSLGATLGDYLDANMEMANLAMKGLNCLMSDQNRDQPPNLRSPNYIVPIVSHSFSVGKGDVEQLQCLRLDPSGQTPHPRNLPDEMKIDFVSRKFGLLKIVEWNYSKPYGTLLWNMEMAPLLNSTIYNPIVINGQTFRELPPIAVLSSLFCYWRGDIELRFDVVASQFHTGKLMVAFIPGLQNNAFTIKQAQGSPFAMYDIQEGRQFVFRIPYIACRPWWPVKFSSSDISIIREALGQVLLFVLNPLVPMDNVPKEVHINIYIRAGENFELTIPSSPKVGSANHNIVKYPDKTKVHVLPNYTPSYTTYSKTYLDGIHLTLYRATTSGAIAYFTQLQEGKIYQKQPKIKLIKVGETEAKEYPHRIQYFDDRGALKELSFVVKAYFQSYQVVYCFESLQHAQTYVRTKDPNYALVFSKSGPYEQYQDDKAVWADIPSTSFVYWHVVDSSSVFGNLGENEEVECPVTSLVPPVKSSDYGLSTFGETCNDLKDLCRRYSRYFAPATFNQFSSMGDTWAFTMPVMPQRLALLTSAWQDVDNILREGHISLISSAYRFSRGGLRFRIVFGGVQEGESVFVQFRPDAPCYGDVPATIVTSTPDFTSFMDPAYPCVFQGFVINNVIEFEVPWYMTGDYNLLQSINFPKGKKDQHTIVIEFSSLGSLYLFVSSYVAKKTSEKMKIEIFYSLADDCRFSTFIGFPPVIYLKDITG